MFEGSKSLSQVKHSFASRNIDWRWTSFLQSSYCISVSVRTLPLRVKSAQAYDDKSLTRETSFPFSLFLSTSERSLVIIAYGKSFASMTRIQKLPEGVETISPPPQYQSKNRKSSSCKELSLGLPTATATLNPRCRMSPPNRRRQLLEQWQAGILHTQEKRLTGTMIT